jgi:hypothetical protein
MVTRRSNKDRPFVRITYHVALCAKLDAYFSKQAGKGRAAGRKKFLEFSIATDQGKKQ